MKQQTDSIKYFKVFDKRKHLFGVKIEGQGGWHIKPQFEGIGIKDEGTADETVWFKQQGKYGYYHICEGRILIPAMYGCPLFFNANGQAIAWKDYKTGVINLENQILIPLIYDNLNIRHRCIPIPEEENKYKKDFIGYVCFTNEGAAQAYDENCQPTKFKDWEMELLNKETEYDNPDVEGMSLTELEERIKKEYVTLIEQGYPNYTDKVWSQEHCDKVDAQEKKVRSLLADRQRMMNRSFVHNMENAKRIKRTNDLLMRAIRKAIKLGKKTSKSLQWMEKVSHTTHYEIGIYVYPKWKNSKSELGYERKHKSSTKENQRLKAEFDNYEGTHIWNIIAALASGSNYYEPHSCCDYWVSKFSPDDWDEHKITMDDGVSWDEGMHYPVYQDVYFTYPWYCLHNHHFLYSFEDLCNINDFLVNVEVQFVAREQDRVV